MLFNYEQFLFIIFSSQRRRRLASCCFWMWVLAALARGLGLAGRLQEANCQRRMHPKQLKPCDGHQGEDHVEPCLESRKNIQHQRWKERREKDNLRRGTVPKQRYPNHVIKKGLARKTNQVNSTATQQAAENYTTCTSLPYMKGLGKPIGGIFKQHGINAEHKSTTLRNHLHCSTTNM